jgi:hypothetical protein
MAETDPLLDEEQPAAAEASKGLASEYTDWSSTMKAFEEASFHIVIYFLLGILFYSYILDTKLGILEAVYFCVSIFTMVGYGDITPSTSDLGMVFTVFFAVYGIIILGIFLGIFSEWLVGKLEERYDAVEKGVKDNYLKKLDAKASGEAPVEEEEDEYGTPDPIYNFFNKFDPFIADLYLIAKNQQVVMYAIFILGIPIGLAEGWSIVEGFYWLTITGTTIGFGDLSPASTFAEIYCIFYIPLTVILVGHFVGNVADLYVSKRNDQAEEKFLNRALTQSCLEMMDADNDNEVSKLEFLTYMLKTLGKVEQDDLDEITELFAKLDKDGSGTLTIEDIKLISEETAKIHDDKKK